MELCDLTSQLTFPTLEKTLGLLYNKPHACLPLLLKLTQMNLV
jgi:hypothetical protein